MSHTPAAPEASTTFEYSRAEYLEGMAAVYNHLVPGGFPVGLGLVGAAIQGLAGYMGGLVGPDLTFSIVLYGTLLGRDRVGRRSGVRLARVEPLPAETGA